MPVFSLYRPAPNRASELTGWAAGCGSVGVQSVQNAVHWNLYRFAIKIERRNATKALANAAAAASNSCDDAMRPLSLAIWERSDRAGVKAEASKAALTKYNSVSHCLC